jgi:hypothetical protein
MKVKYSAQIFIFLLFTFGMVAMATASHVVTINLQNHIFEPSVITIPENIKIKLVIVNHDASPEEFDSFDLNREKVIFAKSKAVLFIGPLPKGSYDFFGEFHPETAQGKVVITDCVISEGAETC